MRFLCCLLRVCAFLCASSVSVPPLMASMDIGRKRPFRGDWALCVPGSHAKDVWKSPCDQVHAPVTSLEVTVCPPKGGQPCLYTTAARGEPSAPGQRRRQPDLEQGIMQVLGSVGMDVHSTRLASPLRTGLLGPSPADTHLSVSLQSRSKGPVVEQQLQTLLGVIVTQLLKGGRPVLALVPRILKAWRVNHHDGSHRQMLGGERSGERKDLLVRPSPSRDGETEAAF